MAYFGIDRVGQAIINRVFAHYEEFYRRIRIVDERVGDTCACRKRDGIAFVEFDEVTVYPETWPPFNNKYKLLVFAVRVR